MKTFLCLAVAFVGASCSSFGAKKLVSSHTAYNDAVQLTVTREVLANVVRSRYADPMQFLRVNAINAQFSVNVGGSAGAAGIGQSGSAGALSGSVGYSDSPTITYTPQSDAAFYKSMYGSAEVGESAGFEGLYRFVRTSPEWHLLTLRGSFAMINGASDVLRGKQTTLYDQRIGALGWLLENGAAFVQIPEWDFDATSIEQSKVTAEDKVKAFGQGLYFIEEDGGARVRLARYRLVLALNLPDPGDPETVAALRDLGVTPGRSQYVLRPPLHATPGNNDPYAIWGTPRSMIDTLSIAAYCVEVPAEHAGIVPTLEPLSEGQPMPARVRIHNSSEEPPFPYRIQHRGYWFYVDDTEIESKMFLDLLVAAYTSRVGSKEADSEAPQVVIGVGG